MSKPFKPEANAIVVRVSGGVVQDVYVPPGLKAYVVDYDVDGNDPTECQHDEDGVECYIADWSARA